MAVAYSAETQYRLEAGTWFRYLSFATVIAQLMTTARTPSDRPRTQSVLPDSADSMISSAIAFPLVGAPMKF